MNELGQPVGPEPNGEIAYPILGCSRGCRWKTSHPFNRHLKPGDRCPNVTDYDRIDGTKYCRRKLRIVGYETINKSE